MRLQIAARQRAQKKKDACTEACKLCRPKRGFLAPKLQARMVDKRWQDMGRSWNHRRSFAFCGSPTTLPHLQDRRYLVGPLVLHNETRDACIDQRLAMPKYPEECQPRGKKPQVNRKTLENMRANESQVQHCIFIFFVLAGHEAIMGSPEGTLHCRQSLGRFAPAWSCGSLRYLWALICFNYIYNYIYIYIYIFNESSEHLWTRDPRLTWLNHKLIGAGLM